MNFLDKLFFAYRSIRYGSESMPVRSATRYTGGVTVTDDPDNDETVVDVSGGGGGNATALQGVPVSATSPTSGYVLKYNGSEWAPQAAPGGGGIDLINNGVPLGTFTSINLGGLTALDLGGGAAGLIPGPMRLIQINSSGTQTYSVARDNMFLLQNANMAFVIDPPGAPFSDVPDATLVVFVMRVAPGTVTIAFSGGTVEGGATYAVTALGKVLSFRYDSVHTNWILVSSVG